MTLFWNRFFSELLSYFLYTSCLEDVDLSPGSNQIYLLVFVIWQSSFEKHYIVFDVWEVGNLTSEWIYFICNCISATLNIDHWKVLRTWRSPSRPGCAGEPWRSFPARMLATSSGSDHPTSGGAMSTSSSGTTSD